MAPTKTPIDSILSHYPWAELTDAYGVCSWFPKCLNDLCNQSADIRQEAWGSIFGLLNHQQTHYEGTGEACASLIRLACLEGVPERAQLVCAVAEILFVDEEDYPLRLSDQPLSWVLHWQFQEQQSWNRLADVYPELLSLVRSNEPDLAFWAARILDRANTRYSSYPIPDSRRPELDASEILAINSELTNEADLCSCFDDDESDLDQPSNEIVMRALKYRSNNGNETNQLLAAGVDKEFLSDLQQLSPIDLRALSNEFNSNTSWVRDESFVCDYLQSIRSYFDDEKILESMLAPLCRVRVRTDEAATLICELAMQHTSMDVRREAAFALSQLSGHSSVVVECIFVILEQGEWESCEKLLEFGFRDWTTVDQKRLQDFW